MRNGHSKWRDCEYEKKIKKIEILFEWISDIPSNIPPPSEKMLLKTRGILHLSYLSLDFIHLPLKTRGGDIA